MRALIGAETIVAIMPRTIATNTDVDREALLEFVRPRHRMILMTPRSDGGSQASPVTAGVDAQGRIVVSTYPDRAKSVNVARRATASVVVLSDDFNGPWVQVDGDAELLRLPEALRLSPVAPFVRRARASMPAGVATPPA